MKHTVLKSALICITTTLLFIFGTNTVSAQYYYQMKVRTIDGLITPFDVNRIDSVYFELVGSDDNGNEEDETTVTGNATDITTYTATITSWAYILDNLSSDLKVGIIYSSNGTPNKSNGNQITVSTSNIGDDAKYSITLTDLAPSTTYYYRSFVYQSGIWFYGNVKEFTTKGQGVELVSGEVSQLTCYSAKVSGAISIDETTQYRTITYGICYSTNAEPTVNDKKVEASSKDQDGSFTCQLRALSGSTTYNYRSYAYVDNYISYGPIRSFSTNDDDVVITGDIDTTTYTVKSTLKIDGEAYSTSELGVCYGTNETPTVNGRKVSTNEVDDENNFVLTLVTISSDTVYYRSYVIIDNVAHYGEIKSFIGTRNESNGYEFVDLGLSVLWATCNVGASAPEEYGNYYAWGETEPKTEYSWSTYKYCKGSYTSLTKYNNHSSYGSVDNKTTLDTEDDVAHVIWGGDWRMPTQAEFEELFKNCTWKWTSQNGINGYWVTSKKSGYTDRSIFLPAAGWCRDANINYAGIFGYYWSSSLGTADPSDARNLCFISDNHATGDIPDNHVTGDNSRSNGDSVRPVCSK